MKLRSVGYAAVVAATAAAFVIGSVNVGEAKSKKKAAAAAPAPMGLCFSPDAKYCAVKGGLKFTYVNKCTAKAEGAKIISNKACGSEGREGQEGESQESRQEAEEISIALFGITTGRYIAAARSFY
jgi:hypothetical protein